MIKAIKSLKEIFGFVKVFFDILMNIIKSIGNAFTYTISIAQTIISVLGTFPSWLQTFGFITLTISITYFIIGRETGKSD